MNSSLELFSPKRSAGSTINFSVEDLRITLVWCPAGEFLMDYSSEDDPALMVNQKRHRVTLKHGFWICQTPVTQSMWKSIFGSKFRSNDQSANELLPVEAVSWDTAIRFCTNITQLLQKKQVLSHNHRISLPTEAQWEYACRAGTITQWYFGNDESELQHHAWYQANSGDEPHPVGLKQPNPWGIYDVYGNVAEWCLDDFYTYSAEQAFDPSIPHDQDELKIVRGGDYASRAEDCQSASRRPILKNNPFAEETGFRVVCVEQYSNSD